MLWGLLFLAMVPQAREFGVSLWPLAPQGRPPQLRCPSWYLIDGCENFTLHVSAPPSTLWDLIFYTFSLRKLYIPLISPYSQFCTSLRKWKLWRGAYSIFCLKGSPFTIALNPILFHPPKCFALSVTPFFFCNISFSFSISVSLWILHSIFTLYTSPFLL